MCGYPYFLGYEMEVASPFHTSLHIVSGCEQKLFRLHFSWTIVVARILLLKRAKSGFYVTIYHKVLRSFINMFVFLYLKANFMEICEEISSPSFKKNADGSIFVVI